MQSGIVMMKGNALTISKYWVLLVDCCILFIQVISVQIWINGAVHQKKLIKDRAPPPNPTKLKP